MTMLADWAENMIRNEYNAAVGIDIRSSGSPELLQQVLSDIREDADWKIVFIDAKDEVLQRRFSTVRRRHPYLTQVGLEQAIAAERQALGSLHHQADVVFDSSNLTPYQLSDLVESYWKKQETSLAQTESLVWSLVSFSYQRGLPSGADMVMDMRFLPNPHYERALAPLTGKDKPVQDFLSQLDEVQQAEKYIQDWLSFVCPKMVQERKRYFTIGFGCSGGRHRSVYMTEMIAQWLSDNHMGTPIVRHREIGDIH